MSGQFADDSPSSMKQFHLVRSHSCNYRQDLLVGRPCSPEFSFCLLLALLSLSAVPKELNPIICCIAASFSSSLSSIGSLTPPDESDESVYSEEDDRTSLMVDILRASRTSRVSVASGDVRVM